VSGIERTLCWAEGRLGLWAQLWVHSASLHLRKAFTSLFRPAIHSTRNVSTKHGNHLGTDWTTSIPEQVHISEFYVRPYNYVFILILFLAARPPSQFHALLSRKVTLVPFWKFTVHGTSTHRQRHCIWAVFVSESLQRNSRHFTQWPQEDIFWCVLLVTITVDISVHNGLRIDSRYRFQKKNDKYPH